MTALDDLATTPFHDADAPLRARMLSRLADTQLTVALQAEPEGDEVNLRMFPLETGQIAIACDTGDRLAGFFGQPMPYVAMPGRVLGGLLRAEGAGLLVNPGHPSEMLLDARMLDWLQQALSAEPQQDVAALSLTAPSPQTVQALADPLAARLADLRDMIGAAALMGVGQGQQPDSHVLMIAGADEAQQPQIAKALAQTLAFLPPQPGGVDISFSDTPVPANALRFDLTPPQPPTRVKGPPILR